MSKKVRNWLCAVLIIAGLAMIGVAGWVWFDENVDRSGWVQEDGVYSYRDFHGKKVTGWVTIADKIYHFDAEYRMQTGWQDLEVGRCYFGADGVLRLGLTRVDGQIYYFNPSTGAMSTGWQTIENGTHYFSASGPMVTGWQEIEGNRYYFDESGVLATQWLTLETGTYYLGDDGVPRTGRQDMEDGVRFFREDGTMVTGWLDEEDGKRWYDDSGLMQTGWLELDGKRYFLSDDGLVQTGWREEGEYRYYLQEDGSAAVGKQSIDGRTYYFTPKGILVVLVNKDNPIPDDWTWDTVEVEKDRPIQRIAAEPLRQMLADCRAAGNNCYLNSAYRTHKQQTEILKLRTQEYEEKGMTYEEAYEETLKTVALPGTSEHELGLSTDLVGKEANEWLAVHCWEYGFILRYPADKEDITGITNEPWHFRYVGVEVAMDMKDTGLCLEEYLGAV